MEMNINWEDIAVECGVPIADVEQIGEGWDAVVFRIDHDLVFKLANRESVSNQLSVEANVLQFIESRLPIRTPKRIMGVGESQAWPLGYAVHEHLEGVSLSSSLPTYDSSIAEQIGAGLRSLHSIDLSLEQRTLLPRIEHIEEAKEFVGLASQEIKLRMGQKACRAIDREVDRIFSS